MYPRNIRYNNMYGNNDRFLFPFLGGALIGGAAVGLSRPRPIYNVAPYYGPNYGPRPYYGAPYFQSSYSYYRPYPYYY